MKNNIICTVLLQPPAMFTPKQKDNESVFHPFWGSAKKSL